MNKIYLEVAQHTNLRTPTHERKKETILEQIFDFEWIPLSSENSRP